MTFWFYDGAKAPPSTAAPFEDTDEEWRDALSEVDVVSVVEGDGYASRLQARKLASPAVCAGEFKPGTEDKFQSSDNLLASHGLVLDVDVWQKPGRPDVEPFTAEDLKERLEGFRFIAWTTFSSTPDTRKWRVVIPFDSPMPTSKYASLWKIINEALADTMGANTKDPARLGFFRTVNSEIAKAHYQWFINPGERLDWSLYDLLEEEVGLRRALTPADLSRSPDWSSDEAAKERAKKYYRAVGRDVEVGDRHATMLRASCRLWWDWAAPTAQWVFDVLNLVNNNFAEPKPESEVWKEVQAGHDRVMGEQRVEQPTTYGAEREPETKATKTGIIERGKALKRQAREEDRVKGRALTAIGHGEVFAEPIEARKVTMDVAAELATLYSREMPERLLDLMQMSLAAQRDRSATHPIPTDQEILSKIRWKQKEIRQRADDREKVKNDELRRTIMKAFNGQRDTPYTQKEYRDFEAAGFNDDQWILQHGKDYYFMVGGEYQGPYTKDVAVNFARVWLSPAYDRLKLTYIDKQNNIRDRTLDELVRSYGTYIDRVEKCSYASKSTLVEIERKLMLPMLLRPVQAEYIPEVAQFLKCLAQGQVEQLLTWCAGLTSTDRELSALMFATTRNQGKALFANGVARLWSEGGIPSLHDYKPSMYEQCCVFSCDEHLPPSWIKKPTATLRRFLSEAVRDIKKPYGSPYSVIGFPRLIFAANDLSMFGTAEDLDAEGEAAALDRFLLIDTRGNTDAEKYLKSLGSYHRKFVTEDLIAKHVLHLRETRNLPSERFIISSKNTAQVRNILYANNNDFVLLYDWIVQYLVNGVYTSDALVMDSNDPGVLYVNFGALVKAWAYVDKKGVSPTNLGRVMRTVCSSGRYGIYSNQTRSKTWFRRLRMDLFEQWMLETANLDPIEVQDALVRFAAKKSVAFTSQQGVGNDGDDAGFVEIDGQEETVQ